MSLLPNWALPKLFPTVSRPSTLSSLPSRSFPTELSPKYFPQFPFRPPSRRFHVARSPRSSPQAISHNFPSVHPFVAPVSLLPTGSLPKLFPTVSLPSTLSSFPYRSFPPELSPSYFPRFPFRPPCRHSRIAPSHWSSPQAISHGFPSVHPVITPVSLLPTEPLPKPFPTAPLPSTLSSFPYRSFPPELSPSYFPSVHPVVISFPSTLWSFPYRSFRQKLSPSYFLRFPFRPPCRHSRISPSHRSSPQAISHGFPSVHLKSSFPYRSFPQELSPSYFPRFPFRPPLPELKLFPTPSLPSTLSSLPYHSFPPELSPSYFPRLPFRPPSHHSRSAPSHRSSPQAIPTVSLPSNLSSLPHRSFPPTLSPSYFTRFPFRPPCRHSRIAPFPTGALPKLFHTASLPSTLSSLPHRSFPGQLLPSYFPRFPFRPPSRHSRSFPPELSPS